MDVVKKDIEGRKEIEILVNRFYDKVKADTLLAPVFSHVNWPAHLPVMYNFWASALLGDQSYRGNPLQKHLPLAIDQTHFKQWLFLFMETIDQNFSGQIAEEAKQRAESIAGIFQFRMGLMENN
ncbi:MAG: group III truncated hemoglobin [Bacteroidetes bacterium]|nr:group III truncated hemoglobin [Bacteroidota bacterium]